MYAVVAPNFSAIYTTWGEVDRIAKLYPYPKWKKCATEQEAHEFIKRNTMGHLVRKIYNYGNTFPDLFVNAKYKIGADCIYYVFDMSNVGDMRIQQNNLIVEYKGSNIYVKYPNIYLSNESIPGHMSAIANMLDILGDLIDINITVPYYSVFYALTMYEGNKSRAVKIVKERIKTRLCEVAFTLNLRGMSVEEIVE